VYSGGNLFRNPVLKNNSQPHRKKKYDADMYCMGVFLVLGQECRQDWKARCTLKVNSSESLGSIAQNLDCSGSGI